jgi:phosphatidylserine decarboxylase
MRIPIARQGVPFIAIGLALVALFLWLDFSIGWGLAGLLTLFVVAFFRDPERSLPQEQGTLLAPADGKVLLVEEVEATPFAKGRAMKISIFMSVFNCHINRIPWSGKIKDIRHRPGKFFPADKARASAENEQNALLLQADNGQLISLVQVAGLIARRIVCWVRNGETVKRGDRFGLIRFGSRVDLYLPLSVRLRVKRGDRVKAGLTVMGEWL